MEKKMKKIKSRKAFTIVEIVTVVTIIAILVGILLPAIGAVRRTVLDTKEHAQLGTISLAIQAFKNDYGRYPESDWYNLSNRDYSGAQMLSEALLGWDLLGFHPKSQWCANGKIDNCSTDLYEIVKNGNKNEQEKNLDERIGPYLELDKTKVFHLGDLFDDTISLEDEKTYVISDVYRYKKITNSDTEKREMAGSPVLYYKADTRYTSIYPTANNFNVSIYDYRDNFRVIQAKDQQEKKDGTRASNDDHWLLDPDHFYEYIKDKKIEKTADRDYPYRPDSYILISAGLDGEYGTEDDITNF